MKRVLVLRQWVKARQHPAARFSYRLVKGVRRASFPVIPGLHHVLYAAHRAGTELLTTVARILWWTPLFQTRLIRPAPGLFLYGGMPLVLGNIDMTIGRNCRISGQTTISGRSAGHAAPTLSVGSNCDIGWQTTIAVGRRISIGDNVRIAGRALLAGYPGHPLAAIPRAKGCPDTEDQVGDIVLENDVWLATGVSVLAGVHIGQGTVVAAGSVVTHDLPPGVLAGGIPARVIRTIEG
jgi:acetyltransferase-like isoleucine patch superfamily enzyme